MRFNKFWKQMDYVQYMAAALALCTFGLLALTPLFLNLHREILKAVSSTLYIEEFSKLDGVMALIMFVAPIVFSAAICGLASRLAFASLRFAEFKLLRYRLKCLEKSLAGKGHPYRVAPEDSQMRVRVAVELEDDIALHTELQNELKEMAS